MSDSVEIRMEIPIGHPWAEEIMHNPIERLNYGTVEFAGFKCKLRLIATHSLHDNYDNPPTMSTEWRAYPSGTT
jgi:hypothetical protein